MSNGAIEGQIVACRLSMDGLDRVKSGGPSCCGGPQSLDGSFSDVSKPIIAREYALFSNFEFRDLLKIHKILHNL